MDHKAFTFALKQKPDKTASRHVRHLSFIRPFTSDIQHMFGTDNVVIDALSRIEEVNIPATIDFPAIAEAQKDDEVLQGLRRNSREFPIFSWTSYIIL